MVAGCISAVHTTFSSNRICWSQKDEKQIEMRGMAYCGIPTRWFFRVLHSLRRFFFDATRDSLLTSWRCFRSFETSIRSLLGWMTYFTHDFSFAKFIYSMITVKSFCVGWFLRRGCRKCFLFHCSVKLCVNTKFKNFDKQHTCDLCLQFVHCSRPGYKTVIPADFHFPGYFLVKMSVIKTREGSDVLSFLAFRS